MRKAIKCSQCYRALCSCRCSGKVKNNWPHTSKNFDFRRSITSLWKLLWVKTFQIWVSLNETFNLIYSFLCFDENWNFTFFTYWACVTTQFQNASFKFIWFYFIFTSFARKTWGFLANMLISTHNKGIS